MHDGAEPLTAEAVVQRIQADLGGEWPSTGPDGFKAGDPSTVIKGIAATAMATIDVLRQAAKANANLILTYEPTFYGRADGRAPVAPAAGRGPVGLGADDPVVNAKREFIQKNGLVVFRLRDHWQARKQNDMVTGLADSLGWSKHRVKPDDVLYEIPPATAEETVALIRGKLDLRGGLRAVGDRKATVRRVLLHPGAMTPEIMWRRYSEVDMIVAGEVREWENTHYAADIFTAGEKARARNHRPHCFRGSRHARLRRMAQDPCKGGPIAAGSTPAIPTGGPVLMTAREVIGLIKQNSGAPWNRQSYRSTFKVGNPDQAVKGIAVTMMTTFDMIKRAHAAGLNMVIAHEDTFWNDRDDTKDLKDNPLYKLKTEYVLNNDMIVWRDHDNYACHEARFHGRGITSFGGHQGEARMR